MAITSSDIHNQSFSIDRKGYDVDEVDVFLEHVADEIDGLNEQIADLEDRLEKDASDARFDGFDVSAPVEDDAEPAEKTGPLAADASHAAELAEKDELLAIRNARIADLEAKVADLEDQLADSKADGSAIAQALIIAQRSADETVASARDRASQIIKDAEDEADRILDDADDRCQQVFDEIKSLESDREKVRDGFQEMLKDFIGDATRKLADIGEIPPSRVPAAGHARVDAGQLPERAQGASDRYSSANQVPIRQETLLSTSYATPQASDVVVAAAAPKPAPVEKDLSGFGDADDDFELEDID